MFASLEFSTWNFLCVFVVQSTFRCRALFLHSKRRAEFHLRIVTNGCVTSYHFLYVCKNCTGISSSYNEVACFPVCVTSDQTDISSKDMPTSGHAVNVSDIFKTDIKPQSSDYVATRQVNQCLEDIVSKCDTISYELDKLKGKLVSFPNQATAQSDFYGSHNHSKIKKWSKPDVKYIAL